MSAGQLTHSFSGLFIFALPAGLAVWLFYVAVLEKATITLLSDRWHTRFAHTDALTAPLIGRASIAIVLGAVTHLLWDAFCHRATFVTKAFPVLLNPTPGISWLPIYQFAAWPELGRGSGDSRKLGTRPAPPAREVAHPALQDQRANANCRALVPAGRDRCSPDWSDWWPYAHAALRRATLLRRRRQHVGAFRAWCGIAVGMWTNARSVSALIRLRYLFSSPRRSRTAASISSSVNPSCASSA